MSRVSRARCACTQSRPHLLRTHPARATTRRGRSGAGRAAGRGQLGAARLCPTGAPPLTPPLALARQLPSCSLPQQVLNGTGNGSAPVKPTATSDCELLEGEGFLGRACPVSSAPLPPWRPRRSRRCPVPPTHRLHRPAASPCSPHPPLSTGITHKGLRDVLLKVKVGDTLS